MAKATTKYKAGGRKKKKRVRAATGKPTRVTKTMAKRILDAVGTRDLAEFRRRTDSLREDFPNFFTIGNFGDDDPALVGFRRFSERFISTDLDEVRQDRQYVTAVTLWHKTPIARYFVDLKVSFLTSGRVTVQAQDERVAEWIQNFLTDPFTKWSSKRKKVAREGVLSGELLMYPHVNGETGHVRPTYISPAYIKGKPLPVPGFPDMPDRIQLKRDALRLLGILPMKESDSALEDKQIEVLDVIRPRLFKNLDGSIEEKLAGNIFFVPVNHLLTSLRGHSQLLSSSDQIDAVDEALFAMIERLYILNLFIWHLKFEGMSEAKIREKEREIRSRGGFKPGGVFGTNEKVTVNPLSGSFNNADFVTGFDKALNVAAMSFGIPQAWLGLGDLVNRASAQVSETPIMKMLFDAREVFRDFERELIQFHVLQGKEHGSLLGVQDLSFEIVYEEFSKSDQTEVVGAVNTIAGGLGVAQDRGWISENQAKALFRFLAEQLTGLPDEETPGEEGVDIVDDDSTSTQGGDFGAPDSPEVETEEERADAAVKAMTGGNGNPPPIRR